MTIRVGVNAHPLHQDVTPELVGEIGAQIVRFPIWLDSAGNLRRYQDFIRACAIRGIESLIVLDERAHAARFTREPYAVFYKRLAALFPTVRRVQVLNEPDGLPNTASGPEPPDVVSMRLRQARQGFGPNVILYAPGMAGNGSPGGTDYLKLVDLSPVNVIAVHIYGAPPTASWPIPATGFEPMDETIRRYQRFGKPVCVTEFGAEAGLFKDEHERAQWFSRAFATFDACGVAEADPYCLTASQGGDLGLVDGDGKLRESFAAVAGAAQFTRLGA